jgi:hypothetical protein
MSREYVRSVNIRWTIIVTYSTGILILVASKGIERMFELTNVQYILLLIGFAVLYLVLNLSLIPVNLSSPLEPSGE